MADTGIGIASEHQNIIFHEFAQIENALQRKVRGTGLGLPLSKKLAELLGGSVHLTSQPGLGSTFTASVPIVYASAQSYSDVVVTPELDQARTPVLVIEDEIEPRLLYEKYLRGTVFQAVPARNLREARQLLDTIRPAAIVLDIMLRDEQGWELLPELRAHMDTRHVPVLVVTNLDDSQKAMALGADAYCKKPVWQRCWNICISSRGALRRKKFSWLTMKRFRDTCCGSCSLPARPGVGSLERRRRAALCARGTTAAHSAGFADA